MRGTGKALQVLAVLDPDDAAVLGWMFRCTRCGGYALGGRADMLDAAAAHCRPPRPADDGGPRGLLEVLFGWTPVQAPDGYRLAG